MPSACARKGIMKCLGSIKGIAAMSPSIVLVSAPSGRAITEADANDTHIDNAAHYQSENNGEDVSKYWIHFERFLDGQCTLNQHNFLGTNI